MRLFKRKYQAPRADAQMIELAESDRDTREDYMIQAATELIYETEGEGRGVVQVGVTYVDKDGTLDFDWRGPESVAEMGVALDLAELWGSVSTEALHCPDCGVERGATSHRPSCPHYGETTPEDGDEAVSSGV